MNKWNHSFGRVLTEVPAILADHYGWLSMPDVCAGKYETILTNDGLQFMVATLANFLDLDIGPTSIETIALLHTLEAQKERIKQMDWSQAALARQARRDPVTTLHDNHIISGAVGQWKSRLTKEQVADVEKVGLKYLMENGYLESTD